MVARLQSSGKGTERMLTLRCLGRSTEHGRHSPHEGGLAASCMHDMLQPLGKRKRLGSRFCNK